MQVVLVLQVKVLMAVHLKVLVTAEAAVARGTRVFYDMVVVEYKVV